MYSKYRIVVAVSLTQALFSIHPTTNVPLYYMMVSKIEVSE